MKQLLVFDIDGTLRDTVLGIPDSTKKAIALAKEKGHQVIINTGRSKGTITDDILALPIDGFITGGGSYIEYHNVVLYKTFFCKKDIEKVLAYLNHRHVSYAIESQEQVFMNQGAVLILEAMNQEKKDVHHINSLSVQEKIKYEDTMKQYHYQDIHKLCLWAKPVVLKEVQGILLDTMELAQRDKYKDIEYYEIIQRGSHKGNAINIVQQYLGISKEQTICFGDGQNDMTMFKASGISVAMKKSHPDLLKIASSICEDILEDGIYQELKRRAII